MRLLSRVSLAAVAVCVSASLTGGIATAETNAEPSATTNAAQSKTEAEILNQHDSDFWFEAEDGTRTFDVVDEDLVSNLLPGDVLKIDGDTINVTSQKGELVASIKADLPDGVFLKETDGKIRAVDESVGFRRGCIGNKWVGYGINVLADGLVCTPFGLATGGVGGFACGAAVAGGVTAASC